LYEQGRFQWEEFRERLIAAIARAEASLGPERAFHYYACWLEALQGLLVAKGLFDNESLAARESAFAARPHGHDH
jgi:nitrile hydratase accessory protein